MYSFENNGKICINYSKYFYRCVLDMDFDFEPITSKCFYGKRFKTLGEPVEEACSSKHEEKIVIIPPEVDTQMKKTSMI